jgi:hypothetical protein
MFGQALGMVEAVKNLSLVEQAIRKASEATGVDFGFLMRTAKRESGYNANAKANTSSAAGLFQFVGQTWLQALKSHGAAHGYARYAQLIQQGGDGKLRVEGPEATKAVMDLRYDAHAAAAMAGAMASDHAAYLRGRVGRAPTGGELYAAHFLGPQGSAKLIEAKAVQPAAAAALLFPEAAAANPGVFYHGGQPKSVAQLYADLSSTGGGSQAVMNDPGQPAFARWAGAGRLERMTREKMMVDMILNDGGGSSNPGASLISAQMLQTLAAAKHDEG